MKKYFYMVLMYLACAAIGTACKGNSQSKGEGNEPTNNDLSLVATTWQYNDNYWKSEYSFKDAQNVRHYEIYYDGETHTIWGTYTFDGKKGTMHYHYVGRDWNEIMTLDGDKLTVNVIGEDKFVHSQIAYKDPGDVTENNDPGQDPNLDTDPNTDPGSNPDNGEQQCWKITISATHAGQTYTQVYYVWGTETQAKAYAAIYSEQTEGANVTVEKASGQDPESCETQNNN